MNVAYNKSPVQSDLVASWYKSFYETKLEDLTFIRPRNLKDTLVFITTFGSSFFAEYQIKTLRKYFVPDHTIIIVDTNEDLNPEISQSLITMCFDECAGYIKMPKNHYQEKQHFDPSLKLGTVLNWLYYNVVKVLQPKYFFFLDHDCFLFRPADPRPWLIKKGMYGTVCQNGHKWNLHVTQCGFEYDFVKDLPIDFRPSWKHGLDTFGAAYDVLFSTRNIEDYRLKHTGHRFFKEDTVSGDRPQHYEIIDECWIHLCASTHDALAGEGQRKLDYLKGFLDSVLLD